jgi:uncharacterized repeat protein (TIGR03803 family)
MPAKESSVILSRVSKVVSIALFFMGGALATCQTETVLYNFGQDASVVASLPSGRMILDGTGALYSIAQGGSYSHGVVFRLTPPSTSGGNWAGTLLYSFKGLDQGAVDGAMPLGGVIADGTGILSGTTSRGGLGGRGCVFNLTPPATSGGTWTESPLHFFGGNQNGMAPSSGLLRVKSGALYGTTEGGGSSGAGMVFRLTPPATGQTSWAEKVLYSFAGGSDGGTPSGEVVLDKSGALYGMTSQGGMGFGTIYKLTPPVVAGGVWTESVLYSFTGARDGADPWGGIIFDSTGALYGTASGGGASGFGTVFQLAPPSAPGGAWSYSVLVSFAGVPDGAHPLASLTMGKDGSLYGTTTQGGASKPSFGTIFRLAPPAVQGGTWAEKVIFSFTGNTIAGDFPNAPLILSGGAIYGTTEAGGAFNAGTVFKLVP